MNDRWIWNYLVFYILIIFAIVLLKYITFQLKKANLVLIIILVSEMTNHHHSFKRLLDFVSLEFTWSNDERRYSEVWEIASLDSYDLLVFLPSWIFMVSILEIGLVIIKVGSFTLTSS